jgi:hypothetical protein
MEAGEPNLVETKPRREPGRCPDSMAFETRSFGVAGGAEVTRARGADAVLADEVTIVNEVRLRRDVLGGEIDVAAIASANGELIFVLVAAKAEDHRRKE